MDDPVDIALSICSAESLRLIKQLGGGSYKLVYLAQESSGIYYALKIIRDPNPSPRTLREVESLVRCDHPSIARLFRVGSIENNGLQYQYLIEEYLSGGSLSNRLNTLGRITENEAISIGSHLIHAIGHLYELGLVHRDIKPDNIIFREDGNTPVLVDFGTVRDLGATSLTESWLLQGPGTPYFASPEQLNNQKYLIDWRSDQFSLGVTLYYSLTGFHPYQSSDEGSFSNETINRVALRDNPSEEFYSNVRNTYLQPLETMVAQWPVQRFTTPPELLKIWGER